MENIYSVLKVLTTMPPSYVARTAVVHGAKQKLELHHEAIHFVDNVAVAVDGKDSSGHGGVDDCRRRGRRRFRSDEGVCKARRRQERDM